MPTPSELEAKFWKALDSDRTVMLGLDGMEDGHARPMTAMAEHDRSPLWFFTSADNALVQMLPDGGNRAVCTFVSKGHDIWASIHGRLTLDTDRAVVDRLWNPHVAAWYEHGKDDPKLRLLRLDAEGAEIWEDSSSMLAGLKSLLGADPKKDAQDKRAEVSLS